MKSRMPNIQYYRNYPESAQQKTLKYLCSRAALTEWGTTYKLKDITNQRQFQEQLPLQTYESMYPSIERVLKGEKDVVWPGISQWFSKSSGTTNDQSKYIPVTSQSLSQTHYKGGKDLLACYFDNVPNSKIMAGKSLAIGGSYSKNPYQENSYIGDVSAVIMANLPTWAQFSRTPALSDAVLSDWEEKLKVFAEKTGRQNVSNLAGVPTWTVLLVEKMMKDYQVPHMLELWPNMEAFFHGGVSFVPYRRLFETYFPSSKVRYMESYNASEGYFGIQDDVNIPELLLLTDHGIYYEFIKIEDVESTSPKTYTISEIQIGQVYSMVISTSGGLWRYMIGDTIEFTSLSPIRFKIAGRTKHFINAFGEELMVDNADRALALACEATGAIIKDYTAAPIYLSEGKKGGHEWLIEFVQVPLDKDRFVQVLDQSLQALNSDYQAKRQKDLALIAPIIHIMPSNTFYKWLKNKGKLGGQHKIPRLSNDRTVLEEIKRLILD